MKASLRVGEGFDYIKNRADKGDEKAAKDLEEFNVEVNPIVWESFRVLNQYRDFSPQGISGLKISEIVNVLSLLGIKDDVRVNRMIRQIGSMDSFYKSWVLKNE